MIAVAPQRKNIAEKTFRAAIYCRKSHEDGLDSEYNSLDAQRDISIDFIAKREGWQALPQRYDDGGFSGGNMQRPALQRLLRDVERGLIDMVLVYRWDRLSRSSRDYITLIDFFDKYGVSCMAVTQPMDTTNAMGRFTQTVMMGVAQLERETAAERIRDKVAAAKKKGLFTGGPPVLGYDIDHSRSALQVNNKEAQLVLRVFTEFNRGISPTKLVQKLNAEGETTKSYITVKGKHHAGQPWNIMHVYRLVKNPLYLGLVVHKGEFYPGVHAPLITQDIWDSAHAILAINDRVRANNSRSKTPSLLKGIIRCGHCEAAMVASFAQKPGKKYRYYLCLHAKKAGYNSCPLKSVPALAVEEAVVEQLRAIFRSPELAATTFRNARAIAQEHGRAVDSVFRESEVIAALSSIDPIWEVLNPDEQARVVRLLVEQVTLQEDCLEIIIRVDGLHSLIAEVSALEEEIQNV